jgi:cell division protein FtsZ
MTLNLTIPKTMHTDFTPRITVIGVGGGGTNAVDNMIQLNLQGVEFVVANTDAQQLMHSRSDRRIQLGPHLTQGLGAGAKPEIGRLAAEEAADELARHLDGAHMVFITAGMGGGTGTGAAPVIARMARERGILTVGVVTKPFTFEGARRSKAADVGIAELQQFVDTLIVIPNQNLFRLANEKTGWKEAFKMADHVLYMGVRGVTDLMVAPGLVNLDFADIRTVMAEMGKAMMGTGEADGENRAIRAAEAAISNPLLEDTSMAGARGLLINITGGEDMTLFEVDQAANRIREEVAEDANIIFGSAVDDNLAGRIRVSVVATGIDTPIQLQLDPAATGPRLVAVGGTPQPAVSATRVEAPRPEQRPAAQAATAQSAQRFPVGMAAVAVAYAPQEEEEQQAQPVMQTPQPRPVQQHPLFTQPAAAPEPAPQPHRGSLFGMVTGGWRRAPQPQPTQELPDLRHQRPEPRFAEHIHQPTAQVRAAIAEPEPQGLDIPAFLRRQDSGR